MALQGYLARPDRFSENGEKKKCTGVLHREGVMLPLTRFHTLKSGKNAGKPMPECIECWRVRHGRDPQGRWVQEAEWKPVVLRLVEILGTKTAVADALGENKQLFSRKRKDGRIRGGKFRKMERLLHDLEKGTKWNQGEAEIIENEPFGSILRQFIDDWNKDRPQGQEGGKTIKKEVYFMGAIDWLAEKTGIHPRRVAAFKDNEIERIPFTQADALLQAMNLTHYMGLHGIIQPKPNPQWSMETYLEYMRERGCI